MDEVLSATTNTDAIHEEDVMLRLESKFYQQKPCIQNTNYFDKSCKKWMKYCPNNKRRCNA
jgi:hypothetical protein